MEREVIKKITDQLHNEIKFCDYKIYELEDRLKLTLKDIENLKQHREELTNIFSAFSSL